MKELISLPTSFSIPDPDLTYDSASDLVQRCYAACVLLRSQEMASTSWPFNDVAEGSIILNQYDSYIGGYRAFGDFLERHCGASKYSAQRAFYAYNEGVLTHRYYLNGQLTEATCDVAKTGCIGCARDIYLFVYRAAYQVAAHRAFRNLVKHLTQEELKQLGILGG